MESSDLISQQIIASIKKRKLPAYMRYTEAAGNVVLDFSRDIGYSIYEYFDTDNRGANRYETTRLVNILKKGNIEIKLRDVIKISIQEFTSKIPVKILETLPERAGKITGGIFITKVLMQDMASLFTTTLISKICFNATLTTAVMLGGARARAIYSSKRLFNESPKIYYLLKDKGDLDLLYFLAEDYLEPFIKAISISKTNPDEFYKIIENVINSLMED